MFITIDTTRADHLGCYGNNEVKTPRIDEFAREAVLFEHCYSPAHSTNPSHTSMFMSLYQKDHNVTNNRLVLPEDDRFLPKVFKANEYRTAGFISAAHLGFANGFGRGLDSIDVPPGWRTGDETNDAAIKWLKEYSEEEPEEPYYVWIHFFDPHTLYEPPPPYDKMYNKTSDERMDFATKWKESELEGFYEFFSESQDPEYYRNLYKGEVSFLDSQLGRLFDNMKELGIYDDTTIVIVADHGENMGDHGRYFEHKGLYDSTTWVPLIIKPAGGRYSGRRGQLVSSVDIYPTLLELVGLKQELPIRGISLKGILSDPDHEEIRDGVFSCTYHYDYQVRKTTSDKIFIKTLEDGRLWCKGLEIYDVEDIAQEHNLAQNYPELADEFDEEVEEYLDDRYSVGPGGDITDEGLLDTLKSLGYVN